MHELSIARSIVRVCEDAARDTGARGVTTVYLRLGPLAGVVRESLEFAYDFATEGSLLTGSRLVIEPVPVIVRCLGCDLEVAPESPQRLRCPVCSEPTPDVVSGRELTVRAIDYDEATARSAASAAETSNSTSPPSSPSRAAPSQPHSTP
ncbi:MAG: hydrogenase maturation nickel metallochaperone HypA [Planctomycetota bacterium]